MERVFIVRARRTAIGKFFGSLSRLSVADMGEAVVRAVMEGLDDLKVDEVMFGCGRQATQKPNPARQIAVRAGLGFETMAHTVNMACGSGLKSIWMAAEAIWTGRAKVCVVGGGESMSGVPFYLDRMRTGYRLGHGKLIDGMYHDGFDCPLAEQVMGRTAETLAERYEISRLEQDEFALGSQRKAGKAMADGAFEAEIVPLVVKGEEFVTDEHVRAGTTLEKLGKLPAVFKEGGTVHAGNASGITDGAAALLVVAESVVKEHGLEPLGEFEACAGGGVDPKVMGLGPVPATKALFENTGLGFDDFGLIELNEAFAAQVLACHRELGFDMEKLNVHGGAIALGHPIGCTGARIVVTLLHAMQRHDVKRGLATLCISGGQGLSASFARS